MEDVPMSPIGTPNLTGGLPIRSFREPSPRFCLYWWRTSHTGGCANTFFCRDREARIKAEIHKDKTTEYKNTKKQTLSKARTSAYYKLSLERPVSQLVSTKSSQ